MWKNKRRDNRWSFAIIDRDEYKCRYCGGNGTDPAHILRRGYRKLRYVLENGLCLCHECHFLFDSDKEFREKLIRLLIKDIFIKLGEIKDGRSTVKECRFTEVA